MEEILIGDKKYISSKQAAKVTGYAKDYVGQLCREGRVPARLVGRSWYVLESAIQDHRFGEPKEEPSQEAEEPVRSSLTDTWDAPIYKEDTADLSAVQILDTEGNVEAKEPADALKEAWDAWFKRTPVSTQSTTGEEAAEPDSTEEDQEEIQNPAADGEVEIPIRTVYASVHEEALPQNNTLRRDTHATVSVARGGIFMPLARTTVFIGAIAAAVGLSLAVLGSGYADTYVVSVPQAHLFAGVSLYNK